MCRKGAGFDILQVDQSLEVPPFPFSLQSITLLRGDFDPVAIRAALTASGYTGVEIGEDTVLSRDPNGEIDIKSALGRRTFGRLNNVLILADGTLAVSRWLDSLVWMPAVARGEAPSLADHPGLVALLAAIDTPLAAVCLVDGATLAKKQFSTANTVGDSVEAKATAVASALATQEASSGIMPPIRFALFGVTPGALPPAADLATPVSPATVPECEFVVAVLTDSPAEAEQAVARALARLDAGIYSVFGAPPAELFRAWSGVALLGLPVGRFRFRFRDSLAARRWEGELAVGQIALFAW